MAAVMGANEGNTVLDTIPLLGSDTRQCTKAIMLHTDVNVGRLSHQ